MTVSADRALVLKAACRTMATAAAMTAVSLVLFLAAREWTTETTCPVPMAAAPVSPQAQACLITTHVSAAQASSQTKPRAHAWLQESCPMKEIHVGLGVPLKTVRHPGGRIPPPLHAVKGQRLLNHRPRARNCPRCAQMRRPTAQLQCLRPGLRQKPAPLRPPRPNLKAGPFLCLNPTVHQLLKIDGRKALM